MFVVPLVLAALVCAMPQIAADSVDRRLRSADPGIGVSRFIGYPARADEDRFVPNPLFWAKDVDFSCASPWNSACGSQRAGTLISKRHIIFAKHFPLWKGVRVVFVDNTGVVCPCTIEKTASVARSDIMIGLLNAEVTPNIHPVKILPTDAERYLGCDQVLPVATFDKNESLRVTEISLLPHDDPTAYWQRSYATTNEVRRVFRGDFVGGDSGNPAFLIIENEPILLYCLKAGGCGAGPSLRFYRKEIQSAMDELCPGYKLEMIDLAVLGAEANKEAVK